MPVSVVFRFCRLFTNRPAPNSSRKLSATCAVDQALAQEERAARSGDGAHRVFQRRPRIGTAGAQRGQQAEDDAGEEASAQA